MEYGAGGAVPPSSAQDRIGLQRRREKSELFFCGVL
jgi:hypothetical protein